MAWPWDILLLYIELTSSISAVILYIQDPELWLKVTSEISSFCLKLNSSSFIIDTPELLVKLHFFIWVLQMIESVLEAVAMYTPPFISPLLF